MKIDIKEIQNLLYVCNVNFYDMYVDTEHMDLIIEFNELLENVDMDELMNELNDLFREENVEFNGDDVIYINLLDEGVY